MFVVRGINIFPAAIADALSRVSPALQEFVVTLPPSEPYDFVPLSVETDRTVDRHQLAQEIAATIKDYLGCTAKVTLVDRGQLPRREGKTDRVLREH
jgi:phenylacetate-CoA ligase